MASKNDMVSGLDAMFGIKSDNQKQDKQPKAVYDRICTIANVEKMNKLRAIAKKEGLPIKDVLEAAMDLAISAYESKHGVVKVNIKSKTTKEDLFS